jgi:hypothetical protein
MSLTPQQLWAFADRPTSSLLGCFAEKEEAVLRDEAERISASERAIRGAIGIYRPTSRC